mgnify:CR=1 FL=1
MRSESDRASPANQRIDRRTASFGSSSRIRTTDRSIAACSVGAPRGARASARPCRRASPPAELRAHPGCHRRCRTSPIACTGSFTAFISWRTATSTRPRASARCCWRTPDGGKAKVNDPRAAVMADARSAADASSTPASARGRPPRAARRSPNSRRGMIQLGLPPLVAMRISSRDGGRARLLLRVPSALLDEGLVDVAVNAAASGWSARSRVDQLPVDSALITSVCAAPAASACRSIRRSIAGRGRRTAAGHARAPGRRFRWSSTRAASAATDRSRHPVPARLVEAGPASSPPRRDRIHGPDQLARLADPRQLRRLAARPPT